MNGCHGNTTSGCKGGQQEHNPFIGLIHVCISFFVLFVLKKMRVVAVAPSRPEPENPDRETHYNKTERSYRDGAFYDRVKFTGGDCCQQPAQTDPCFPVVLHNVHCPVVVFNSNPPNAL